MSHRMVTMVVAIALLAALPLSLAQADTNTGHARNAAGKGSTTEVARSTDLIEETPAPDVTPSKPFDGSDESANEIVSVVANHIYASWRSRGYVDQVCNTDKLAITVTWKATAKVPQELRSYMESKPYGVNIILNRTARYDRAELWQGRNRILADPLAAKLGLVGGTLNQDGSGMTFISSDAPAPTDEQLQQLRDVSGIDDITVTPTKSSGPSDYSSRTSESADAS